MGMFINMRIPNGLAENGDLAGLKYYFDNRIPHYNDGYNDAVLFCIACENKHYHIMKYLSSRMEHICSIFGIGSGNGMMLLKEYCKKQQFDIVIEIIKITIRKKKLYDFNFRETVWDVNGTPHFRTISEELARYENKPNKGIYYLESCGAHIIHKKLKL